jgi:regulator of sigma E protease
VFEAVNGQSITTWSELPKEIHERPNQNIDIIYQRGSTKSNILLESTFQINPSNGDTIGIIGIYPKYQNVPVNLIESMNMGATATVRGFGMAILTIKMLTSGQASMKELGGPILIAQLAGQTAEAGWVPFLTLMALISCNIAFIIYAHHPSQG